MERTGEGAEKAKDTEEDEEDGERKWKEGGTGKKAGREKLEMRE